LSEATVNIVGVGNVLMGDDGVGPAAIEALRAGGAWAGVELHDAGLAVSDVLGRLDPADPLIVIDALRAGGRAGDIHTCRLEEMPIAESSFPQCLSLHELSVMPALRIEAMTGRAFGNVTLFGVEPKRIAWGEGLSPPVAGAMDKLIEAVLEHARKSCTFAAAGDTSR